MIALPAESCFVAYRPPGPIPTDHRRWRSDLREPCWLFPLWWAVSCSSTPFTLWWIFPLFPLFFLPFPLFPLFFPLFPIFPLFSSFFPFTGSLPLLWLRSHGPPKIAKRSSRVKRAKRASRARAAAAALRRRRRRYGVGVTAERSAAARRRRYGGFASRVDFSPLSGRLLFQYPLYPLVDFSPIFPFSPFSPLFPIFPLFSPLPAIFIIHMYMQYFIYIISITITINLNKITGVVIFKKLSMLL